VAPTWTRLANTHTVLTFGGFVRQDQYNYYPSDNPFADLIPDLQLQSIGQSRTLTNAGLRATVSYAKGIHNLKAGITYSDTILTEKDALGVVDPATNAVCLNADGSPYTGPGLTNSTQCGAGLTPNPSFSPLLACYDLTRTAALPASDGCPNSTSGLYHFYGHANIRELSAFIQDTITKNNWTFNVGLRFDYYDGLVTATQPEPRMGIAYNIKPTSTVLRISYARSMETPFN